MSGQQAVNIDSNKSFFALYLLSALTLFVWAQSVAYAESSSEARSWLEKMSIALQKVNYQGVFVYRQDEQLSAMQVTHVANAQGEHELLVSLTGEEREVLRNNQRYSTLVTQDGEVALNKHLATVGNYYDLKLLGHDRTAGRVARLLVVTPKDEFRYGYRLWLDEETGLLLKSEILNSDGKILEQVMFTSLELMDSSAVNQFKSMIGLGKEGTFEEEKVVGQQSDWSIANLPSGFVRLQDGGSDISAVDHMVFSDGLASVSVFIEKAEESDKPFVGVSRRGAVNAYGGLLNGHQVTVVGEVPAATVRSIGQSISRQEVVAND